jgi:hypothetical protein
MADLPGKTDKTAPTLEVALLLPHTHAGKRCGKGKKINVTEAQAEWLRQRGVVAPKSTGAK